jgi:hypothetical protein
MLPIVIVLPVDNQNACLGRCTLRNQQNCGANERYGGRFHDVYPGLYRCNASFGHITSWVIPPALADGPAQTWQRRLDVARAPFFGLVSGARCSATVFGHVLLKPDPGVFAS